MKSAKVKRDLIEELKKKPVIEAACAKAGVGRTAFYEWKKKDPEFAKAVDLALSYGKAFVSDIAEMQLLNAIKSGDFRAVSLYLKTHHPDYRNRLVVEDAGVVDMTPEQQAIAAEGVRRITELRSRLRSDNKK